MRSRANIVIHEKRGSQLVFYTHSTGYDLPELLRTSLYRGRYRWNDEPYLSRIIFSDMIKGQERISIGFGISTWVGEGDKNCIEVKMGDKLVCLPSGETFTFSEYCHLKTATWDSKSGVSNMTGTDLINSNSTPKEIELAIHNDMEATKDIAVDIVRFHFTVLRGGLVGSKPEALLLNQLHELAEITADLMTQAYGFDVTVKDLEVK